MSVIKHLSQSRPFGNICSNCRLYSYCGKPEAQRGVRNCRRSHSESVAMAGLEPRAVDTQSPNSLTTHLFLCAGPWVLPAALADLWPLICPTSSLTSHWLSDWVILLFHPHLVELQTSSDSAITRKNFFTPGDVVYWIEDNITFGVGQQGPNLISSIYRLQYLQLCALGQDPLLLHLFPHL